MEIARRCRIQVREAPTIAIGYVAKRRASTAPPSRVRSVWRGRPGWCGLALLLALSTLLSRVLGRLTVEAEVLVGNGVPLAVWANVLRCVGRGTLDERDLPEAARVSKRLAAAAVTNVTRAGSVTAQPARGKQRTLCLTEAGATAAEVWPPRLAELDQSWVGTPLREALENVVGRLPFELPHFPASYGSADPSAIGGPFM